MNELYLTKYMMSSHLLSVNSNTQIIPGWRFGIPPIPSILQSDKSAIVCCKYIVTKNVELGESCGKYLGYFTKELSSEKLFTERIFLGRSSAKMVINGLSDPKKDIEMRVTPEYLHWTRLSVSHRSLVGRHLSNAVIVKLLENEYIPLHSAMAFNNISVALFAPPNTGKTTTIRQLVNEKHFHFLCDDIGFTNGVEIYGCPLTATYLNEKSESNKSILNSVHNIFYKTTEHRERILDHLPENRLIGKADTGLIILLGRGGCSSVRPLGKEEGVAKLFNLSRLEFNPLADDLIRASAYLTGQPDLLQLQKNEINIWHQFVNNALGIFEINVEDPKEYVPLILDIYEMYK